MVPDLLEGAEPRGALSCAQGDSQKFEERAQQHTASSEDVNWDCGFRNPLPAWVSGSRQPGWGGACHHHGGWVWNAAAENLPSPHRACQPLRAGQASTWPPCFAQVPPAGWQPKLELQMWGLQSVVFILCPPARRRMR